MKTGYFTAGWLRRLALCAAVVVLASNAAEAQTLRLTLSRTTIPFASADPDTTPLIDAPAVTVSYRVRGNAPSAAWQLTLLAEGNFTSGSATIPASAVTWTATPAPPFQAGTMNATVAQRLAGGTGNVDPTRTALVTFRLANSWSFDVGTYSTVFTFTLIAP